MTKYYCDICGKEMIRADMNVAVYHAPCVVERVVDKYDCCRDCLCEVLNYIDERQKCFGTYKTNPALNKKG